MSWLRKYKFTAGPAGGTGFSCEKLRISFDLSKTEEEDGNSANISIWNLSRDHEDILKEKDCYVKLEAGYEDTPLLKIFEGYVTYCEGEQDGADWCTSLELVDGRKEVRDTYMSKSYSGSTKNKTVIDDIASEMGLTVTFADNCKYGDVPNGYSFVGKAAESLDKVCAVSGLQWYIDNGVMYIKNKKSTLTRKVFELSPKTGMIGSPRKLSKSGESDSDEDTTGYEVDYFLNAGINVSDYIFLNSKHVQGFFRVKDLKISGDSHSGDWMCTASLMQDT